SRWITPCQVALMSRCLSLRTSSANRRRVTFLHINGGFPARRRRGSGLVCGGGRQLPPVFGKFGVEDLRIGQAEKIHGRPGGHQVIIQDVVGHGKGWHHNARAGLRVVVHAGRRFPLHHTAGETERTQDFVQLPVSHFSPFHDGSPVTRKRALSITPESRVIFSFPDSAWERPARQALPAGWCLALNCGPVGEAEPRGQCLPRQSLGTRKVQPNHGRMLRIPTGRDAVCMKWPPPSNHRAGGERLYPAASARPRSVGKLPASSAGTVWLARSNQNGSPGRMH